MDVIKIKNQNILKEINKYIIDFIEENETLKKQLFEYSKDEEIQKLKKEIQNIRRNSITILTDKQKEKVKLFSDKHYTSCKCNIEYIITGTSLGECVEIQCKKCKESEDVTDFDNW